MSLKSIFRLILGKKEKVMIPNFNEPTKWSDKFNFELHTFMKTDAGQALIENLRFNVISSQMLACKPSAMPAAERLAFVHGKEALFCELVGMYKQPETPEEFHMDEDYLKDVIKNRINGYTDHELVEL